MHVENSLFVFLFFSLINDQYDNDKCNQILIKLIAEEDAFIKLLPCGSACSYYAT